MLFLEQFIEIKIVNLTELLLCPITFKLYTFISGNSMGIIIYVQKMSATCLGDLNCCMLFLRIARLLTITIDDPGVPVRKVYI